MNSEEFRQQFREIEKRRRKAIRMLILFIAIVIAAAVFIFQFVCGIAVVHGESMIPGLRDGTVVLYFRQGMPGFGDVTVLKTESGIPIIKRVIGLEGDTIEVDEQGKTTRNGVLLQEDYAKYGMSNIGNKTKTVVELGRIFVLGDNRSVSIDSRAEGSYPLESIQGTVFFAFQLM